jgi:hypothetical protein
LLMIRLDTAAEKRATQQPQNNSELGLMKGVYQGRCLLL